MGRKKTAGLFKKGDIWQIDKQIFGRRLRMTTGTRDLNEAELVLARYIESMRQTILFGDRKKHTFQELREQYFSYKTNKASIEEDKRWFDYLETYIGHLTIEQIHMGTLQPYIAARQKQGLKNKTINMSLATIRHALNLAANEWIDENGLTWLHHASKIRLLPIDDSRQPYPLTWQEQERLFAKLSSYLRRMALFKVNTGCREQEVCQLQWDWEIQIPELKTSVFLIPRHVVKNRHERLVVLNRIAQSVIEEVRGMHEKYVFVNKFKGALKPLTGMNNSGWKTARMRANLPEVRVHDLKHTFGRRLRAAGVSFEDRQDLLGHKSSRITTHYSSAEVQHLIDAANKVCDLKESTPTLTLLKLKTPTISPLLERCGVRVS